MPKGVGILDTTEYFPHDSHQPYVSDLENICKEKNLNFEIIGDKNDRTYFLIAGGPMAVLGFFTLPNPQKSSDTVAANRISDEDQLNLKDYENQPLWELVIQRKLAKLYYLNEEESNKCKVIKGVVLQIWRNDGKVIAVPVSKLSRVAEFNRSGDFRIKKTGDMYEVDTPGGSVPIPLKSGLNHIFNYTQYC